MGKLLDWALDKIDHMPAVPAPFLIAFIVVMVLILPAARRALTVKVDTPAPPLEAVPMVMLNAGGVYTVLINIEVKIQALTDTISKLADRLEYLESTVRRQRKRRKVVKKKTEA